MSNDTTQLNDIAERIEQQLAYDNVIVLAQREAEHEVVYGHNRGPEDTLTAYIGLMEVLQDRWMDEHWRGNERDRRPPEDPSDIIPGGDGA